MSAVLSPGRSVVLFGDSNIVGVLEKLTRRLKAVRVESEVWSARPMHQGHGHRARAGALCRPPTHPAHLPTHPAQLPTHPAFRPLLDRRRPPMQTAAVVMMKLATDTVRQLDELAETMVTRVAENQEGLVILGNDVQRAAENVNKTLLRADSASAGTSQHPAASPHPPPFPAA